jgi:hypothetical protein
MATAPQKRTRLSIDLSLVAQRRISSETIERESLLALSAQTDPVLAELWDNSQDAAYDRL